MSASPSLLENSMTFSIIQKQVFRYARIITSNVTRVSITIFRPLLSFCRKSQGGLLVRNFFRGLGVGLPIFGPKGTVLEKFLANFRKNSVKMQLKSILPKIWDSKFFPDTRELSRKWVLGGQILLISHFSHFWALSTRYLAIFSSSGGQGRTLRGNVPNPDLFGVYGG